MNKELTKRQIVLLGIGHTNAHIVKMWRMNPIPDTSLVCVSNFSKATYSGMLPGVLAGQYQTSEMEIDLLQLTQACAARLIVDEVVGFDREQKQLLFANRSPLEYDALSIGIGSQPTFDEVQVSPNARLVKIKPMQTFLDRLQEAIDTAKAQGRKTIKLIVVGGGVGGVEVSLCLDQRLLKYDLEYEIQVVHADDFPGTGLLKKTQSRIRALFRERNFKQFPNSKVVSIDDVHVHLNDGNALEYDLVVWATSATGPRLLRKLKVPMDGKGFVLTKPTLQSISDPNVFAVGDSGSLNHDPTPKAGVYAVRQGPILWDNLRKLLCNETLKPYKPQRGFLKLLNVGDGRAIAEYKGMSWISKLAWKWKNWIDQRFMEKFRNLEPVAMTPVGSQDGNPTMRCVGCGGKIGGDTLSAVLEELKITSDPNVIVGLESPDDAAIVKTDSTSVLTTDFFAAPFDDPYTMGRIAVLNALSDSYAMAATPNYALANVQLPTGSTTGQKRLLTELMSGAICELDRARTSLVGGHSIEGPRLTLGFTVLASQSTGRVTQKNSLRPGEQLILTKPLGTGALLAAHMNAKCQSGWFEEMCKSMLQSNAIALKIAEQFEIGAMTDVTGFGLAGHLAEMLTASNCAATIQPNQIPLLGGFEECIQQGFESTMAESNRSVDSQINPNKVDRTSANYFSLFDPQTSGGILISARPEFCNPILDVLVSSGFEDARIIGEVSTKNSETLIELCGSD